MTGDSWEPTISRVQERPRTPLLDFEGKLVTLKGETRKATQEGWRDRRVVTFEFTDVVVHESSEPYPFPTASLELGWTDNQDGSLWQVFADSVIDITKDSDINVLKDKVSRWKWSPAKLRRPDSSGVWAIRDSMAWVVVSIEGYDSPDSDILIESILDIADGHDESYFYSEFFNGNEAENLRKMAGYATIQTQAIERELLTNLVTGKQLTRDEEGIYHKV